MTFTPDCGPVEGRVEGPVVRITGIPYARARRFHEPEAVADWTEVLQAVSPAPACPQPSTALLESVLGSQTGGLPEDEACQNLSVTVPADRVEGELLPVMVWVHGGSYTAGAGDAPVYDASALVAEQRVIVVSLTYRLGVLGYLGGEGRPANLGLLDQLLGFAWVQRNIRAFGGDHARVTAFGQSAGGDAVAHIMATPGASGLFSRAIIQSAPLGISRGRAPMAAAMASAGASIGENTPVAEVVAAQAGVAAAAASFGLTSAMAFGTQYGHAPLPAEDAVEAAWDGVAPGIDVLIGNTAQEAQLFLPFLPATAKLYAVPVIGRPLANLLGRTLTKKVYGAPATDFAARHRRAGGSAHRYTFRWAPKGSRYGAAHAIEIAFLFGGESTWSGVGLLEGATWREIEPKAREVRALWAAFARGELADRGEIAGVLDYARV